ncbi:MAG: hypothetical protein HYW27_00530 [Candidatus Aenigmarchaeota archaeon]|nr:hypothetical protein [Candidatus Aenigmarchaeota archaeon]
MMRMSRKFSHNVGSNQDAREDTDTSTSGEVPQKDTTNSLTDEEYKQLAASAYRGELLIGIDRAAARKFFTDVPLSQITAATGESPYFAKIIVWLAFLTGPMALFASFVLSIMAVRWYSVLTIPVSVFVWFGFYGDSSRRGQRMFGISAVLAASLLALPLGLVQSTLLAWYVVSIIFSLWMARAVYCSATFFLRAFVLRT